MKTSAMTAEKISPNLNKIMCQSTLFQNAKQVFKMSGTSVIWRSLDQIIFQTSTYTENECNRLTKHAELKEAPSLPVIT